MAAKQRARAHTVMRITAKISGGRPPSCHANAAANPNMSGCNQMYDRQQKATEEQQRFDKSLALSCTPQKRSLGIYHISQPRPALAADSLQSGPEDPAFQDSNGV